MGFLTICSDAAGRVRLALAADGTLWKSFDGGSQGGKDQNAGKDENGAFAHWDPVDFNGLYAGYYTPCHFTALVGTNVDLRQPVRGRTDFLMSSAPCAAGCGTRWR